ncbi:MAG: beta-ketoacyl-[acyl-carrier-protein] synthase family protein [Telmatospirillum sp.]|nr:beta-ketoacyl-[acyl-carrier-protein] synthase family protein [Telmatospirillum sp.]
MTAGRRVVVTGFGLASALGNTPDRFWCRLLAGESGFRPISRFDPARHKSRLAAEADDRDLHFGKGALAFELARMASFVRFAVHAGEAALEGAGLEPVREAADRGLIAVGAAMGGLPNIEAGVLRQEDRGPGKTTPFLIPSLIPGMAAGMLALRPGFQGPQQTLGGACAAGRLAIAHLFQAIRRGDCDWGLAGGAEAVTTPITFSGFEAMNALSLASGPDGAPRPFDRRRDGFMVGEGAALLVLEEWGRARARGAPVLGEILGAASVTGGTDIVTPDAASADRSMRLALADAGREAGEIGGLFAQGSGVVRGDAAELEAVARLLPRVAVTSIKAQVGYTFAANGPLSLVAALMSLQNGVLPGIPTFESPDPDSPDLRILAAPRTCPLRTCMVNAHGFGGVHSTLVVGRT